MGFVSRLGSTGTSGTAVLAAVALVACLSSCSRGDSEGRSPEPVNVPGRQNAKKNAAVVRAARRAYDGAPPVIPHKNFNMSCTQCHTALGMAIDTGFAPPMPHQDTSGLAATSRCNQCHVFHESDDVFVESTFAGRPQDLRHGERFHPLAPPVVPHALFMRENCTACHSGPAAREEIRCTHPERRRCLQCHAVQTGTGEFSRD
jgi:cytochrome c-type protein NapB